VTTLASQLVGTWRLVSREDHTAAGEPRVDPGLGADPIGLLAYDAAGNFTAQFMKRDRSTDVGVATGRASVNNSAAVNGYDARLLEHRYDQLVNSRGRLSRGG
jgi:hypothetical protein